MESYSSDSNKDLSPGSEDEGLDSSSSSRGKSQDQTFVLLPRYNIGSDSTLLDRFSPEFKKESISLVKMNQRFFVNDQLRPLPHTWGYIKTAQDKIFCIDLETQNIIDSAILEEYFASQNTKRPNNKLTKDTVEHEINATQQKEKTRSVFVNVQPTLNVNQAMASQFRPQNSNFKGMKKVDLEIDTSIKDNEDPARRSMRYTFTEKIINNQAIKSKNHFDDQNHQRVIDFDEKPLFLPRSSQKLKNRKSDHSHQINNFWTRKGSPENPINFENANEKLSFTLIPFTHNQDSVSRRSVEFKKSENGTLNVLIDKIDILQDKIIGLEKKLDFEHNHSTHTRTHKGNLQTGPESKHHLLLNHGEYHGKKSTYLKKSSYGFEEGLQARQERAFDEDGFLTSQVLRRSSSRAIGESLNFTSKPFLQSSVRLDGNFLTENNQDEHMKALQSEFEEIKLNINNIDRVIHTPTGQNSKSTIRQNGNACPRRSASIEKMDNDLISEYNISSSDVYKNAQNNRKMSRFGDDANTPNKNNHSNNANNTFQSYEKNLSRSPCFKAFNQQSDIYNYELDYDCGSDRLQEERSKVISQTKMPKVAPDFKMRQSVQTLHSQPRVSAIDNDNQFSKSNIRRNHHSNLNIDKTKFQGNHPKENSPQGSPQKRVIYYFNMLQSERDILESINDKVKQLFKSIEVKQIQKASFKKDVIKAYFDQKDCQIRPNSILKGIEKIYKGIKTDLANDKKRLFNLQHFYKVKSLLLDMIEKRLIEVSQSHASDLDDQEILFVFEKYNSLDHDVDMMESFIPSELQEKSSLFDLGRDFNDPLNITMAKSKTRHQVTKSQRPRDRFVLYNNEENQEGDSKSTRNRAKDSNNDDVVSLVSHISRKYNLNTTKNPRLASEYSEVVELKYQPLVIPSKSSTSNFKDDQVTPRKNKSIGQFDEGNTTHAGSITSIFPKQTQLFKNLKAQLDDLLHNVNFKKISKFK
jgi:hypothetical protein